MPAVLTIARLSLIEASRRKLLVALAALTVVVIAVTGFGFSKIPSVGGSTPLNADDIQQIAAYLMILVFFMFSFVLSLTSVFVASPAIASDIESGVILSIVPRPIRRSEIVIGRWLGLCAVVAVYSFGATMLEMEVVNLAVGYLPPHPLQAVGFMILEGMCAVSLGLLFSTRVASMTGGIVATILLLVAWFLGIIGNIGYSFGNDTVDAVGWVSRLVFPTDGLWRGALYYLQTDQLVALGKLGGRRASAFPFYVANPPSLAYLAWVVVWMATIVSLTIFSFKKREL